MRIAITGSTGLIGHAVDGLLRRQGHDVIRLVRREPAGADEIQWDPSLPSVSSASSAVNIPAMEHLDAVVHLAGENIAGRWTADKVRRIRDSRVVGTRNLCRMLMQLKSPPPVLVSASAAAYVDRGDEVLAEDAPLGDGFLGRLCQEWERESHFVCARRELTTESTEDTEIEEAGRREWSAESREFDTSRSTPDAPRSTASVPSVFSVVDSSGIRVVNPRFGMVLDAHGGALHAMLLPFKLGLGGVLGDGRQWWSWISIDDAAAGICHLLKTNLAGPVNFCSPGPATNREFTAALAAALSRPAVLRQPAFMVRTLFGQLAEELLLASVRAVPKKLVESGFEFKHPTLAAAFGHLLKSR